MSRNPLGWHYPAGAEHDPNAPWNQVDDPEVDYCRTGHDCECPCCESIARWDVALEAWVCSECYWSQDAHPDDYNLEGSLPKGVVFDE